MGKFSFGLYMQLKLLGLDGVMKVMHHLLYSRSIEISLTHPTLPAIRQVPAGNQPLHQRQLAAEQAHDSVVGQVFV